MVEDLKLSCRRSSTIVILLVCGFLLVIVLVLGLWLCSSFPSSCSTKPIGLSKASMTCARFCVYKAKKKLDFRVTFRVTIWKPKFRASNAYIPYVYKLFRDRSFQIVTLHVDPEQLTVGQFFGKTTRQAIVIQVEHF